MLLLCAALWSGVASAQCISLTTLGAAQTQNFDTLSNVAGSTTNPLTIPGWFMTESGGGARDNEQYAVDTGASNTGDTFSYGAAGSTDRALGSLRSGTLIATYGACFTNNTGSTLSSLDIAYTGEQWRLGTAGRTDQLSFEYSLNATDLSTGTWTGVAALNFVSPVTTTVGAKDGNAAENRTALSSSIGSLSIASGATFWIRWLDTDATGADDGLAVDDFSLTPQGGGGPTLPVLSIDDVSLNEGNLGTTNFVFTVTLSSAAGAGGVTFDIATADGTAQDGNPVGEDNDYVAQSLTGQTIPAGSSTYSFTVLVNGDTTVEPNETFFVNISNVSGATVGDAQGQGTIVNDDVVIVPIHDIQGPGSASPIVGSVVTTRGIVTGRRSNGFFIQTPDAEADADPATSEGILVFTSSAPPASAEVGALVQVTGTVTEFVPAADPLQPPLTELTSPTVTQISTGNPLPAAIPLTSSFPSPSGPHDQLERLEGMRVSIASLTVGAPSGATLSEANATSVGNGVFQGVVTGHPRAFREPGIQAPDPAPQGSIPPIPRFDSNPEVIRVDSDGLVGGPVINVGVGAVVTNLVGPLDYTFRRYTVLPDPASPPTVSGGATPTAVAAPISSEVTIASYNLQRFFDDVNDPAIGEPVLTLAAYTRRLTKASAGIRNFMNFPDILGVMEVENLSALQALATRINTDATTAGQPNPQYVAYLIEGNDVGGIDVGFLVKTAEVSTGTARVSVVSVVQENATAQFVNADSSTELLNDRPPLRLQAVVNTASGQSWPVTVIANHLRSLNNSADPSAGSAGWATVGERVRAKRHAQAVDLANLVQARQLANPSENIVLVGDFNAFEFNDGLGDSLGVITGVPTPDNQTAVPGDGIDLVNPDLLNMTTTLPAAQRYSFVFDGNAQTLDHVLINAATVSSTSTRRVEHARINADQADVERNNDSALRLADHDPVVLFVEPTGFLGTDLGITQTDSPDPVVAGTTLTYSITVSNSGTVAASNASWTSTLPAGVGFQSLAPVANWSCTTPAVGAGGSVSCTRASFTPGSDVFTLQVGVDSGVGGGTVLSHTATVSSSTTDPTPGNNSATATTTVSSQASMSIALSDSPDPVTAGSTLTWTVNLGNTGPSAASNVSWSLPLPAGTTFTSLTSGFSCTTPAVGGAGTVNCTQVSVAVGASSTHTLVVNVDPAAAAGSTLSATASLSLSNGTGSTASASTLVNRAADLSISTSDSADPVTAGTDYSYTVQVDNSGPSTASAVSWSGTLPTGTTFQSLTAAAGWNCTTPAVGSAGTISCTAASLATGNSVFTPTLAVDPGLAEGTVLNWNVQVSSSTTDPTPGNNSASESTTVTASTLVDLALSLSASPDPVLAGEQLSYVATVSNAGPASASGVTVELPLPAGTSLASGSVTGGGNCLTVGSNVQCSFTGAVSAGGANARAATIVLALAPSAATGTLNASAQVSSTNTDTDPSNNAASQAVQVDAEADLVASLTVSPSSVILGGTVTLNGSVLNNGPSDAQNLQLLVNAPSGLLITAVTAVDGSCSHSGTSASCDFSTATAPGQQRSLSVTARANAPLASPVTLTATATTGDPVLVDNSSSTTLIVTGLPDALPVPGLDLRGLLVLLGLVLLIGSVTLRRS